MAWCFRGCDGSAACTARRLPASVLYLAAVDVLRSWRRLLWFSAVGLARAVIVALVLTGVGICHTAHVAWVTDCEGEVNTEGTMNRSEWHGDKRDGIEYRWTEDGDLDEICMYVAGKCVLHIERMSDCYYWMGFYTAGGEGSATIGSKNLRSHVAFFQAE